MANESLAVSQHASNTVLHLAYLIHTALQERCHLSMQPHEDYHRAFKTLAGLGFTAVLAEGSRVRSCRPHFATFLRYRDFTRHTNKLEALSDAVAEIIYSAVCSFKMLGHPLYYDEFIAALVTTLQSSDMNDATTSKGIKNMLQELFEQCS
jgi:hypothetical protein